MSSSPFLSDIWYLSIYKKRLIDEDVVASHNGPYYRSLQSITKDTRIYASTYLQPLSSEALNVINEVLSEYGQYSGLELMSIIKLGVGWPEVVKDNKTPVDFDVLLDGYRPDYSIPNEFQELMDAILQMKIEEPDLRLGQIVSNAAFELGQDLFYIRDEVLLSELPGNEFPGFPDIGIQM